MKVVEIETNRRCGSCTLCCKLPPMKAREADKVNGLAVELGYVARGDLAEMLPEFDKPANERCPHCRVGKGCTVYARRPLTCRAYTCRWLANDDTAGLRRPDRSHYVIDPMPDFVVAIDEATGERANVMAVQVWCDPSYLDAWRDPALLAYLDRRGMDGMVAVIRHAHDKAFVLFPPSLTDDGQWREHRGDMERRTHTVEEIIAASTALTETAKQREGKR